MHELRQAIADAREDAAVLRRNGHPAQAESLERSADHIARAAEPFTRTLSLSEARLKSGASLRWLKAKAREWADLGFAECVQGEWRILDCLVPQRIHASAVRAQGAEDATRDARRSA